MNSDGWLGSDNEALIPSGSYPSFEMKYLEQYKRIHENKIIY